MKTLGKLIVSKREKLKLTRAQLAKKLGMKEAYLSFFERDRPVRVSESVMDTFKNKLHMAGLGQIVERHNKKADKYNRAYRAKLSKRKPAKARAKSKRSR